jgi:Chromo (CHRromatin Organisation MOdifier) domain
METDGRVFKLWIGDDDVPVSSDRIKLAPVAAEYDDEEEEWYDGSPTDEFVFERITGMKKLNDGTLRYKLRWYGYGPEDDTWEPSAYLPAASLRRYHRKIWWTTSK